MGIFLSGPKHPTECYQLSLPCFFCLACSLSKCSYVKSCLSFTFKCVFLYEPLPDFYTGTYPFPFLTLHVTYSSGMVPPFSYYFKEYLDYKENIQYCAKTRKRGLQIAWFLSRTMTVSMGSLLLPMSSTCWSRDTQPFHQEVPGWQE